MTITVQQVQDNLAKVRQRIMASALMLEGIVGDYPIGGPFRGKCKLGVERKQYTQVQSPSYRYRTIKTTTSKSGTWCAPKKSTYTDCHICVTLDGLTGRAGWLRVGMNGISIQWPNGLAESLAAPPHWCKPRRTPETYKLITRDPFTDQVVRSEKIVQPADPPELCDSYDAWEAGIRDLIPIVKRVWEVKHEVANAR